MAALRESALVILIVQIAMKLVCHVPHVVLGFRKTEKSATVSKRYVQHRLCEHHVHSASAGIILSRAHFNPLPTS